MTSPTLFTPLPLGHLTLPNRLVMAPLTRVRAGRSHVPNELMVEYYRQRASAGLIITECSMIAADASAFVGEGGIFDDDCVAGWQRVTAAVHADGGRIFMQIWHPGRAAHSGINDVQPISSSARAIAGDTHTPKGKLPYEVPRVLGDDELPGIVEAFRAAAERARAAGFDGVQIHGAHGYLIDQFLRDSQNDRSGDWGGTLAKRARLLCEVTDAAIGVFGPEGVGIRISPLVPFNDMADSDPAALVVHVAQAMSARRIAFFELRHDAWDRPEERALADLARQHFDGVLMLNGGFDRDSGNAAIAEGRADAIVYGKAFIANPDLVARYRDDAPLNPLDPSTLYSGGAHGYTDYPFVA